MSDGAVTVRTKKFITNRLLQRKQFVRSSARPLNPPRPAAPAFLFSASSSAHAALCLSLCSACSQLVEVIHPGLAGVSKSDLKEKLATNLKVRESRHRRNFYSAAPWLSESSGAASRHCLWPPGSTPPRAAVPPLSPLRSPLTLSPPLLHSLR